jgi:hypothetical protein
LGTSGVDLLRTADGSVLRFVRSKLCNPTAISLISALAFTGVVAYHHHSEMNPNNYATTILHGINNGMMFAFPLFAYRTKNYYMLRQQIRFLDENLKEARDYNTRQEKAV